MKLQCGNCGAETEEDIKICEKCGMDLSGSNYYRNQGVLKGFLKLEYNNETKQWVGIQK